MALTAQNSQGGSPQSFKAQLTDVDSTAQEFLGQIRYDVNKVYKYVKFSGTTAIAVGDFLCYVTSAGATDTATTVDGANAGGLVGAGVACAIVASGAVAYGWIQVRGLCVLSTALAGTPSIGDLLTNDGATTPAVTTITDVDSQEIGIAFDVTNKLIILTCPT
jgi:hypothetical protein